MTSLTGATLRHFGHCPVGIVHPHELLAALTSRDGFSAWVPFRVRSDVLGEYDPGPYDVTLASGSIGQVHRGALSAALPDHVSYADPPHALLAKAAAGGAPAAQQQAARPFVEVCQLLAPAFSVLRLADNVLHCGIGNGEGCIGRTAIADDHFADHAAHRRRDQAVETAGQQALGILGGDHDGNHAPIMTHADRPTKEFPVAG